MQRISYLTGWEYEYVYGSFTECMDMLERGEIDLFGNVSYTAKPAEAHETERSQPGRGLRGAAAVPIIAMTADAFAEEQMHTLEAGMDEHLSKPIDPPLLYSVLEKYIQPKR